MVVIAVGTTKMAAGGVFDTLLLLLIMSKPYIMLYIQSTV